MPDIFDQMLSVDFLLRLGDGKTVTCGVGAGHAGFLGGAAKPAQGQGFSIAQL
jgi:hypothetical protein